MTNKKQQKLTTEEKDALSSVLVGGILGILIWIFFLGKLYEFLFPTWNYTLGLIIFTIMCIATFSGKTMEARANNKIAYDKQKVEIKK